MENGEEYFPRVFHAIETAKEEVLLETFILLDDKVGRQLRACLISAVQRGVKVDVMVDGYGSAELSEEFIAGLLHAGVGFHIFDPKPRFFGLRTNVFRRMHRKIVVVDGTLAFVGGINFGGDHLAEFGPQAKQDYAVEIRGPVVADICRLTRAALAPAQRSRWLTRSAPALGKEGRGEALFVTRDNGRHSNDIERYYRAGLRVARHDITIANAYFFPGYRLLRDLCKAARRGVRVRLVLQGEPDMPVVTWAARMLYDHLASAGVQIYEYCERPLHGKVACIDNGWATVGSSNLDPFSWALNLEANVFIRDREFTATLRDRLDRLIRDHCHPAQLPPVHRRRLRRLWFGIIVFHFLRKFPRWADSLPAHKERLKSLKPPTVAADSGELR
jgi:cardiolipin synthase